MAEVVKINTSDTGLRIAREASLGVLPAQPVWKDYEPNSYSGFGGALKKVARDPISTSRQFRKGSAVGIDANAGFEHDVTQDSLADLLEAVFLANRKETAKNIAGDATAANDITAVTGTAYSLGTGGGAKYIPGMLLWAEGFADAANNGLKHVTGVTVDDVEVSGLTADGSPAAGASIKVVGFQFASGDAQINQPGASALPQLITSVQSLTALGLIPGEICFLGGDDAGATGDAFNAAQNNGIVRIATIATNLIEFDKTSGGADGVTEMSTEAGGTKTIRLFFGDVTRNVDTEDSDYNEITHHIERRLGKANPVANPTAIQSEVVKGSLLNELQLNFPTEDKITYSATFLSTDHEQRDGITAGEELLSTTTGTIQSAVDADVFNTSNDFYRVRLAEVRPNENAAPAPLFIYGSDVTITLSNNATANKAIAVFGAFAVTPGNFQLSGSFNAFFNDVAATKAVRNDVDVTMDMLLVKAFGIGAAARKSGLALDVPLISLGDGQLDPQPGEAIKVPLSTDGAEYVPFGHTALFVEFTFLPDAADI